MPSAPDLRAEAFGGSIDALPDAARALFGNTLFESEAWYRTVLAAALPQGSRGVFVGIFEGQRPLALFPMLQQGRVISALTTPYTCLWQPLLAPGADATAIGRAFGRWCRRQGTTRLDALNLAAAPWPDLLAGIRAAGLAPLPFDHFGNWRSTEAALGWEAYLARRPGKLREALRRRTKRLLADGAAFRVVHTPAELETGIAAYETVYAASWKQPEPFPRFNAALMRACAAAGILRLGLLEQASAVLAAQIWILQDATAIVLKLAHDESRKAASPGTVLTGLMIRHLLDKEGVTELDFGRGDDEYKQSWAETRLLRHGVVLANPYRGGGIIALLRAGVRGVLKVKVT
jgi:hypothetical protein